MRAVALFVLAAATLLPALAADDPAVLTQGRRLSALFLERKTAEIWPLLSAQMHAAFGNPATLTGFRTQVDRQLGEESRVVDEKTAKASGNDVYLRTSHWSKVSERVQMQWAFDPKGMVVGFFVRPERTRHAAAPTGHLDYRTRAALELPFRGEWLVYWGGRTLEQNYHIANRGQRFAYDMLVVQGNSSHRGEGKALEDYYCWDQPILAPAAGTVAFVVDGLPDQAIGARDPANPAGNHVVLDLGHGEHAFLGHLRRGSVRVRLGEKIAAGEEIGRCGNSGNTSEPHLHFHLQTTPRLGTGDGLPAFFNNYVADDRPVTRGEPVKGQRVRRR